MAKARKVKPAARKAKPAARKIAPAKWSAVQKREYDTIRKRADTLGKALGPQDFDKNGEATGPWGKALSDLEAWAKKYGVKVTTHEVDHGPAPGAASGTPTPMSYEACVPSFDQPSGPNPGQFTRCSLKRKRQKFDGAWKCVYRCVPEWSAL